MTFLIILFMLLTATTATASANTDGTDAAATAPANIGVMPDATAEYNAKNYAEAAMLYQSVLDSEPMDRKNKALVYYNLGNACFKSGELAQAILAYERSLRCNSALGGTARDVRYNLAFARTQIVDNIEDNRAFFLTNWLQFIRNLLTESAWLWISLLAFVLCVAGVLIFLLSRQPLWRKVALWMAVVMFIITVSAFANALSLHSRDALRAEAIITNGIVVAKAEPDRSGTELFTLHEGTKVTIRESLGTPPNEWVCVHVANFVGWIPASSLERI